MSNDAQIKQYREAIEAKRKSLGDKPKLAYSTNASLDLDGARINLNTLGSAAQCVEVVARLLTLNGSNAEANEILGTDVRLKFGGFTASEWISDIKLRLSLVTWEAGKKKLAAMDTRLRDLMSDDAQTADAIADIASQLDF